MKKQDIIDLVRCYADQDDYAFKNKVFDIACDFDKAGDSEIASYLMTLVSNANSFVTQSYTPNLTYLRIVKTPNSPLPLPNEISKDIKGIINAVGLDAGINKFMFQGPPGTGKTESAKHVARLLNRMLLVADFNSVIDSKLGQTSKNIAALFEEVNRFPDPSEIVVLFDEIDALALDRTNDNDVREMGRATSAFLSQLDELNDEIVLIATTNLYNDLDKAIVRRFDYVVDFSRYSTEALVDIAESLLNRYLSKFDTGKKNTRLFKKILSRTKQLPYPAELENRIKTSIAFSNPDDEYDYLRNLYKSLADDPTDDAAALRDHGFSLREIEILTKIPRSTIARELKAESDE